MIKTIFYKIYFKIKDLVYLLKCTPYRVKYGFWPHELWALDWTIAKFILPRLIQFKKTYAGFPVGMTSKEWNNILRNMISSFHYTSKQFDSESLKSPEALQEEYKLYQQGLYNFAKYFGALWT